MRSAGRDSIASETIGGGKAPCAIGERADTHADGFGLGERADLAVFGGEVALPQMHHADIGIVGAAEAGSVERAGAEIPHELDLEEAEISLQEKRGAI